MAFGTLLSNLLKNNNHMRCILFSNSNRTILKAEADFRAGRPVWRRSFQTDLQYLHLCAWED